MTAYQIIFILIAHYLGDCVLQDGAMISNKSRHFSWLVLHNLIYVAIIFFAMLLGILLFDSWTFYMVSCFTATNAISHFFVGYLASKVNAYFKEEKKNHLFWCAVGAEQLIYTSILIYSLNYFSTH